MEFLLTLSQAKRIVAEQFARSGLLLKRQACRIPSGGADIVIAVEFNRTSGVNMMCGIGLDLPALDPLIREIVEGVPTWPGRTPWFANYKMGWSVGLHANGTDDSSGFRLPAISPPASAVDWDEYFGRPFSVDGRFKQWIMPDAEYVPAFVSRLLSALTEEIIPEVSKYVSMDRIESWFKNETRLDVKGPVQFSQSVLELVFGDEERGLELARTTRPQYPFPPASQAEVANRIERLYAAGCFRDVRVGQTVT